MPSQSKTRWTVRYGGDEVELRLSAYESDQPRLDLRLLSDPGTEIEATIAIPGYSDASGEREIWLVCRSPLYAFLVVSSGLGRATPYSWRYGVEDAFPVVSIPLRGTLPDGR